MNYRVIKENDLFFLTDESGDIPKDHPYGPGLYAKDTRFLSSYSLKINGEKPILLSSTADDAYHATMLLTNPHMEDEDGVTLWRESIELKRERFIYNDVLYERITARNYNPSAAQFTVSLQLDADFHDMFIVRGFQHGKTGQKRPPILAPNSLTLRYLGADHVERSTKATWKPDASSVSEKGEVVFSCSLEHDEAEVIDVQIAPSLKQEETRTLAFDEALERLREQYKDWKTNTTTVKTDHAPLQRLIDRGLTDLRVLLTDLGHGAFPVAGLPWFAVPFGRDSLIAALQMLPFNPSIAKGTLCTMAAEQGTKKDSWWDEEPGKIMHEIRFGELANTGQIPFTPYYGTIDATPLFLVLLSEYMKWTGDTALFEELEQNVEAALDWIDHYGDRDGDGFVEYHQEAAKGIANQGWKDSGDSIVHRTGELGETPIALSEVQGYVYQAKTSIAAVYEQKGKTEKAEVLRSEAEKLKHRFDEHFWIEELGYYALALDKQKQQVGTITSNPGHVLMSGMLDEERARLVSGMLTSEKMYSGYGIRTMGRGEAGYNPISYHNGTVWPHDNSLIILGMSRTGNKEAAAKAMSGLIASADSFEYDRLPELFCGYEAKGKAVKYPVACSPQAWAAGTPLLFVQAMLGLFPNTAAGTITLDPLLPEGVNQLTINDMKIGDGHLSFEVQRQASNFSVTINENTTGCDIVKSEKDQQATRSL
ncbi:glycogen debranching N-terminal domain-containing protein [Bacillus daqingensis]|uniref:Glycogen debranching N-terminal domain-containing protein n=1 Tax=Bacillus daqingensis TaxID=872396 RepID=A0ABV9NYG7_9BACI